MTLRNRPVRDGAATAGFTLIEVTVVLVILGLALAQLAQRGPLRSAALDLRAATVTVVQGLRLARARAILADRAVVLAVDAARQTVRVGDDRPRFLPGAVALTVVADDAAPTSGTPRFRFDPDGSASGGRIDLAAGARRASVAVDWLTGRISVRAFDAR
jgi:general secretion pathway protein H